jgi:acylphosphatase
MRKQRIARRYVVRGHVQGVGYRYFATHMASRIGVTGYVRNLDDGNVEVYAAGTPEQLAELAAALHRGPRWADVRGVEEQEAAVQQYASFETKH